MCEEPGKPFHRFGAQGVAQESSLPLHNDPTVAAQAVKVMRECRCRNTDLGEKIAYDHSLPGVTKHDHDAHPNLVGETGKETGQLAIRRLAILRVSILFPPLIFPL